MFWLISTYCASEFFMSVFSFPSLVSHRSSSVTHRNSNGLMLANENNGSLLAFLSYVQIKKQKKNSCGNACNKAQCKILLSLLAGLNRSKNSPLVKQRLTIFSVKIWSFYLISHIASPFVALDIFINLEYLLTLSFCYFSIHLDYLNMALRID